MYLLIAPYPGLKEVALSVIEEYGYEGIDVYVGNYQKGPALLRQLNADRNYEAVITRGGTVGVCQAVTRRPVIEIRITAFDILRILKLAEGYAGKKAFLASENLTEEFKRFDALMESGVETFAYKAHAQVPALVQHLRQEGYELVIGDFIVYNNAMEQGMNSMLITSGKEGVRDAIEEARRLSAFLKNGSEPSFPARLGEEEGQDEGSVDNKVKERCQEINRYVIVKPLKELSPADVHTVFPKSQTNLMKDYSKTPFPTIISGLDGCCKDDAGYLCCCYGSNCSSDNRSKKKGVLIRLDCHAASEIRDFGLLEEFLEEKFQLDGGVLFLEDIDQMETGAQKSLVKILRNLEHNKEVKLMASCELPVEECVAQGQVLRSLQAVLDEVRIELQPLSACSGELRNMVSIYLGRLDMASGNYSAGIDRKGMELLEQYEWPGNLRQFMRVMNHLALSKKGLFIREQDVRKVLKEEESRKNGNRVLLDISGSLEQIERRVIRRVMAEEGMNQSKVEKRLEIGHSTLWRKLKQDDKNVSK